MNGRIAALALACCACARSAANHEVLGDRLYAAADYRSALAEYQLGLRAGGGKGLHAKTAAAALHTSDFAIASQEYRALAHDDPSRTDEAADGLERTARQAGAANDRTALAAALAGLREIAPSRSLGPYARVVALDAATAGNTADAMAYLPTAIATAPDAATADSLLYVYGEAAALAKDCPTASAVFGGVVRRQRQPAVQDAAREGIARCALVQGEATLAAGHPADAEVWFQRASTPGAGSEVARAAALGLGDVALARGDLTTAVDFYQQALTGGMPGDTLAQRAQEKLNALGKADSTSAPQHE